MPPDGSVTHWIRDAEAGDEAALERLWERYFSRVVALCQKKLGNHPRRAADEEDVALSVLNSYCQRAVKGEFRQLHDRDDLWRLLIVIANHKAIDLVRRNNCQRRGGGQVLGESALDAQPGSRDEFGLQQFVGREPTPDLAAAVTEQVKGLLESLEDEILRNVATWKLEGYTNEEIAEKLDCSVRTVERKLAVIRKRLSLQRGGD